MTDEQRQPSDRDPGSTSQRIVTAESSSLGDHLQAEVAESPGGGIFYESSERYQYTEWTGPVASPESLREFAAINPAYPDRLFAMAEREQAHRHEIDCLEAALAKTAIRWEAGTALTSQLLASLFILALVGIGFYLLEAGYEPGGLATLLAAAAALASSIALRWRRAGEAESDNRDLQPTD
ncbi:DUF2335 domain-containing protein [Botrimarina sp.]|uniref:DUF2335 domain-containing protein n=1 Tax=Botrimarina sp. TaxID=2795802 RepID=UPI0032EEC9D0